MTKNRVEAFSDGVIAILITVMVLELKLPADARWSSLSHEWPTFLSYVLSFVFLGIYWNNHHHMFHAVDHISGGVLWANLHLLFWLSVVPFFTDWMGSSRFATFPVFAYGVVLLAAAIAYTILQVTLLHQHGYNQRLARAVEDDRKGKVSVVLYVLSISLAYVSEWISLALFAIVAVMWFIPDRRVERVLTD